MRPILVATDFSPTAGTALARGAELARERGRRLVVVHVSTLHPFAAGGPQPTPLPPDFEARVREASQEKLADLASRWSREDLEIETLLETGTPAAEVVEAARQCDAELIVTGTRGQSGFRHLLLGSTAEGIVRTATCPVLTVHPEDTRAVHDVETVLVPTDFSDDAARAVAAWLGLFRDRASKARVKLLNVFHLPMLLEPLFGDVRVVPASFEEIAEQLREDLEPAAEPLREAGFAVDTDVREGDPATEITEVAAALGADMIVMGTHGRSGLKHRILGSTAERVVQHASCPVFTVRFPR